MSSILEFCSMLFTVSFTFSSDIVNCKLSVSCSIIINLGLVSAQYIFVKLSLDL